MIIRSTLLSLLALTQFELSAEDNSKTPTTNSSIEQKMNTALYDLIPKSYTFVDLGLTEAELALFEELKIEDFKAYDRFGSLELLIEEIPEFLRQIGNDDEQLISSVTDVITKIVSKVTTSFQKKSAWITLRASLPHTYFDMPRWHMDGTYYAPRYGSQYKFAAALRGNPTLFYPMDDALRDIYKENYDNRVLLSEIFDVNNAESPQKGFGAFFVVGAQRFSALHSEPRIDSKRLFMSIVPGHENEIDELYNNWHPKQ